MKTQPPSPFAAFLAALKDADKSPATLRAYASDLTLFAEWFKQSNGKALSPKTLTAQDVREYREYLLRHKKAPATINRGLNALRAYMDWARRSGLIQSNPLENGSIKLVEQDEPAPRWLDKPAQGRLLREAELLVNAAPKDSPTWREAVRNQSILALMLNTGLRIGEVCALEMADVDAGKRKGKIEVRAGKGLKARTIPLNPEALKAINTWLEIRGDLDTPGVFTGRGGEPLRATGAWRMLTRLAQRANVPEMTPHVLRHTFAKNLINAGIQIQEVAQLLGHASLEVTRRYTTPSAADLEQAVGKIGG